MNISISFFSLISVAIGEKVSLGCQIPQISSLIANGFIHIIPNSRWVKYLASQVLKGGFSLFRNKQKSAYV
jgi:hypothetical protein